MQSRRLAALVFSTSAMFAGDATGMDSKPAKIIDFKVRPGGKRSLYGIKLEFGAKTGGRSAGHDRTTGVSITFEEKKGNVYARVRLPGTKKRPYKESRMNGSSGDLEVIEPGDRQNGNRLYVRLTTPHENGWKPGTVKQEPAQDPYTHTAAYETIGMIAKALANTEIHPLEQSKQLNLVEMLRNAQTAVGQPVGKAAEPYTEIDRIFQDL